MRVEFTGTNAAKIFGKNLRIEAEPDGVVIRETEAAAAAPKNPAGKRGPKPKNGTAAPAETPTTMFDPAKL